MEPENLQPSTWHRGELAVVAEIRSGFVWVVQAFLLCYDLLRDILSCLASLIVLIGFFSFLFSLIF